MTQRIRLAQTVEAGGCSAKLSPKDLEHILGQVPLPTHPDLIVGAQTHDDAGVLRLRDDIYLVQTTDFFPPMVDDAFTFGQVAAANALSDIYAMGGTALCALSLVMFPSKQLPSEYLVEMLKGGTNKIVEAGALILGGHTIDDSPVKYGLAVSGLVRPDQLVTNAGARPGDMLILTKALGTSILTGAHKVDLIDDQQVQPAIDSMITLNKKAAEIMVKNGIKGGTDITGFGLLGHAYRFADASGVTLRIESKTLPCLPGVLELIDQGVVPGGCMRNLDFIKEQTAFLPSLTDRFKWLCLDPQTSGGLLMAVPPTRVEALLEELHRHEMTQARVIGEVLQPGSKPLLLA